MDRAQPPSINAAFAAAETPHPHRMNSPQRYDEVGGLTARPAANPEQVSRRLAVHTKRVTRQPADRASATANGRAGRRSTKPQARLTEGPARSDFPAERNKQFMTDTPIGTTRIASPNAVARVPPFISGGGTHGPPPRATSTPSAADGGVLGQQMETLRHGLLVTVSGYTPARVEMFTDDVVVSLVLAVHGRAELVEQLRQRDQVFTHLELDLQMTELADDRLLGSGKAGLHPPLPSARPWIWPSCRHMRSGVSLRTGLLT